MFVFVADDSSISVDPSQLNRKNERIQCDLEDDQCKALLTTLSKNDLHDTCKCVHLNEPLEGTLSQSDTQGSQVVALESEK